MALNPRFLGGGIPQKFEAGNSVFMVSLVSLVILNKINNITPIDNPRGFRYTSETYPNRDATHMTTGLSYPPVPGFSAPSAARASSRGISLTPDLWEIARQLGAGSASRGIQIALRTYAAEHPVPQHLLGGAT